MKIVSDYFNRSMKVRQHPHTTNHKTTYKKLIMTDVNFMPEPTVAQADSEVLPDGG
jgi:sulfur carrier protein ThiS